MLLFVLLACCGDSNEIVEHPVWCQSGKFDGRDKAKCLEGWVAANRTSYKVLFEKQEVVSSQLTSQGGISRYTRCKIWDTDNWVCQSNDGFTKIEFKNGRRVSTEKDVVGSFVSSPCWWYIYLYSHVANNLAPKLPCEAS